MQCFKHSQNGRTGEITERCIRDDVDQAAHAHCRQEHPIRNTKDAAGDGGQDPQARQQTTEEYRKGTVALELSFRAVELRSTNANERTETLDKTPSVAARQEIQER